MRNLLLALAVPAVLLAGCRSLPMPTNADVEQLKYKQDSYQCLKEAPVRREPFIVLNVYAGHTFATNMYRACMEAMGYTF